MNRAPNDVRGWLLLGRTYLTMEREEEAIEAGLHWVDLGLSEVSSEAPQMHTAIESAAPRSVGEPKPRVWVHPNDLKLMCEWLKPRTDDSVARALLDDAHLALQS